MQLTDLIRLFDLLDGIALATLVLAWLGIGIAAERGLSGQPSVSILMADYRHAWLRVFVTREPRIFDGNLLNNLRQGTTFFASAALIALGGGLALIGNPEPLLALAEGLNLNNPPALVWDVKILVALLFMANALFKFVWSHRLFGYCAVVMASVPDDDSPTAYACAARAAELSNTAARSFNRGLRSVYFALGTAAWLLGPESLLAATAVTTTVLWRREFASHSRRILLERDQT